MVRADQEKRTWQERRRDRARRARRDAPPSASARSALDEKQRPGRRRLRPGRRPLRPDERPDVGRAPPAVEGCAGRLAGAAAALAARAIRVLDVAGGTGDIAFRIADRSRWRRRSPSPTSTREMLAVGRERAAATPLGRARRPSSRPMPRTCPSPTAASTPSRSPSASATCRGSTGRSPRPSACSKPGGRFLCLEFSAVDVAGLDRALRALFRSTSSRRSAGSVAGDAEPYRYLVESIRRFPNQARFAAMIERAGFARVDLPQSLRRASPRSIPAGSSEADGGDRRRALPPGRRRLRARPRGRLRARRRRRAAGRAARWRSGSRGCSSAATATDGDRAERLTAALNRLGPSYVKLGQFLATRPDIVGSDAADDARPAPRRDRAVPRSRSAGHDRRRPSASRSTRSSRRSRRRSPPPRSPRSTRPRSPTRTASRGPWRSRCCGPASARRFRRDLDTFYAGARLIERIDPAVAAAAAGRGRRHARPLGDDRDGPPARGGRALRDGRGDRRRPGLPRADGRLGADRPRRADARMDRRHQAFRPRRRSAPPATTCRRWRDG